MSKLLIVDDEPGYRRALEFFLRTDQVQVRSAPDADEAVAIGHWFQPHVLIVDWNLSSVRTGLDVAQQLSQADPSLRTILISGMPTESMHRQAAELPVFRFFEKPFSPHVLVAAVNDALQARAAAPPSAK